MLISKVSRIHAQIIDYIYEFIMELDRKDKRFAVPSSNIICMRRKRWVEEVMGLQLIKQYQNKISQCHNRDIYQRNYEMSLNQ